MATSSIFTDIILDDEKEVKRLLKAVKSSRGAYKRAKIKRFFRKFFKHRGK